ncbi:MAG: PilZ domain [Myxococcaceae bacterium]|nr:PilZ domain [Myxococcaceae bacterium]
MQPHSVGAERRVHPRIPVSTRAELITAIGSRWVAIEDLSMGGAKVRVEAAAGEWGDAVDLRLPGNRDLAPLRATIVRTQRDGSDFLLGLRFDPLPPITRQVLASMLELPS